ncbi:MAG: putative transposase [Planctomycetota bacterium]|jgi:putative transposase
MKAIRKLLVRMATVSTSWGYLRIQGEMKKVGHTVARTTIAKTLKDHSIAPHPDRPTSWHTILKSHARGAVWLVAGIPRGMPGAEGRRLAG